MDTERARELLARERKNVEEALATLRREGPVEGDDSRQPGDRDDEGLYQDEFDAGRERELTDQLEAVERAEKRLAEGTYGVSVRSGEPIPDERLEAFPTAELNVDER
jgi:DnaK suppressor protein